MKLVVLGADSYTGSQFVKWVGRFSFTEVVGWAMEKTAGPNFRGAHVYGMENIASAVSGADVVVNLHEAHDFSLQPDESALYQHNVEFVESLISIHNQPHQDWKLVHVSSSLLQCSSRWPNVNGSETSPEEVPSARPFQAYCSSKQRAELLLQCSEIDCIIVRAVPVYGQGDLCSVMTDLVKVSSKLGFTPRLGDNDGAFQLMSIENLMAGLWCSVEKLHPYDDYSDESTESLHCEHSYEHRDPVERIFETVLLCDNDDKKAIFANYGDFIPERRVVTIPLLPLYYIYYVVAMLIRLLCSNCVFVKKMPDPEYLYMHFHHWTFFNNFKAREYLDYSPINCKEEKAISRAYYRALYSSDIPTYSWQTSRPSSC